MKNVLPVLFVFIFPLVVIAIGQNAITQYTLYGFLLNLAQLIGSFIAIVAGCFIIKYAFQLFSR